MMRPMKDSGIEWIGKIPEGWETCQAKFVILQNDGGVWGEDLAEGKEGKFVIRSTEQTEEGKWSIVDPAQRDLSNVSYSRYRILPNDLLITKSSGSALHIGKTTIADQYFLDHECYYSNFIQRVRVNDKKVFPKYAWYLYNSPLTRDQFVYLQNSTSGIGNINADNIKSVIIPIPPLAEQQAIADYLDEKCAAIDKLIDNQKAQIEKMKEYKQSVITEAVTKGLNLSVPMKDSGIEWIGKIPEGWIIEKAKYTFKQRSEKGNGIKLQLLSPTQNYGVIPQIEYDRLSGMKSVKLSEEIELRELKTIHIGDYCISLRSFQGGFEYSQYEGVVSPAYKVFYSSRTIVEGYYKYLFKSEVFIQEMNSYTVSFRDGKSISFEAFAGSIIPIPPLAEQQAIADYLDEKCAAIDKLIAIKQAKIDKLNDYKKSLIYEYVTGKREVL